MTDKKRILICPLDWGLGHAGRDSKIIQSLSARGHEIIIAGSGLSLSLLKTEFPDKKFLSIPASNIKYDRKIPAWLVILKQFPGWIINIIREHRILNKIVSNEQIDLVISDARYGLWNSKIPSVLITHQLAIKLPFKSNFLERIIMGTNRLAIKRFNACWIPDYQGFPNLGGGLSHIPAMPENARYIGPISRFDGVKHEADQELKYEVVAVISGPEPQRSVFEELLTRQLAGFKKKSLLVCGRPGVKENVNLSDFCTRVSFLTGEELADILISARFIICRSGYSSIMDLASLKKTAYLVPTPGQTEQEYLADYLSENNMFPYCKQKNFNLQDAISVLDNYKSKHLEFDPDLLAKAITELEEMGKPGIPTSQQE
ncbi:MAG: glycosyltransferase [Deltaproteobacteria bacterium]|nr:glycosyltransferase [Deltaproteobacteria bacterium]MBL7113941.1 glycosyltransferase [Bacteroidales bacterium]